MALEIRIICVNIPECDFKAHLEKYRGDFQSCDILKGSLPGIVLID
jgi:hypothetical protein